MEVPVEDIVALVTGATQGIGHAVAEALARGGAAGLMQAGRDTARGAAIAAALTDAGTPTVFMAADLAEAAASTRLVSGCLDRFGRIDALVNSAAVTTRVSVLDPTLDDWTNLFDVNARAPFFLMQGAINAMRARGRGGAIVNILSINIHCEAPELAVYAASKAALTLLTCNAANAAHRFDRTRVNGIKTGWALTPAEAIMQSETLGHGPGWLAAASSAQAFGRLLAPEEVANLAIFLLSDAAGPMTGPLIDQERWVVGANG